MHHNFVICLQEPHLRKHCQANVWAVAAGQNALEGSPKDLLVALAWQVWVMSDLTRDPDVEGILQRYYPVPDCSQHDETTLI